MLYVSLYVLYRAVERRNILGIVNLVVKGLIETSMQQGKTLNDAHPQLQQCLIAMEQALKHRLKSEHTHTHTHTQRAYL